MSAPRKSAQLERERDENHRAWRDSVSQADDLRVQRDEARKALSERILHWQDATAQRDSANAARVAAEGERDRALDAAGDLRVIAEGLVRENERLLRAAGLNPDWSVVPAHLVRKYSAALTPAPEAPTDGE